jgi:CRP-like cAMP-binding protein
MSPRAQARARVADALAPAVAPLRIVQNEILSKLPAVELAAIMEHAEEILIPGREEMFLAGDLVERVYFPLTGMVSMVIVLGNGTTVEALTVGREGFVGVHLLNEVMPARYKGICQIEGTFIVLSAKAFLSIIGNLPDLSRRLHRYSQYAADVAAQSAACNSVHNVEQRCARWLLVTSDAIGSPSFNLTQEFLSQMLAVRRPGVSVAMTALARRGLVSYRYRKVTLLDVNGLKEMACECYATIRSKAKELLA